MQTLVLRIPCIPANKDLKVMILLFLFIVFLNKRLFRICQYTLQPGIQ